MTSSVSCLDVSDSLSLSAPEVFNSSMTTITAALSKAQVTYNCSAMIYVFVTVTM